MMYKNLVIFIVFIGLMYFMMVRPQQKNEKKRKDMLNDLKPGVEVITVSGLHGKIDSIDKDTFSLDADGVFLTFERSAIRTVVENKNISESMNNKEGQQLENSTEDQSEVENQKNVEDSASVEED